MKHEVQSPWVTRAIVWILYFVCTYVVLVCTFIIFAKVRALAIAIVFVTASVSFKPLTNYIEKWYTKLRSNAEKAGRF